MGFNQRQEHSTRLHLGVGYAGGAQPLGSTAFEPLEHARIMNVPIWSVSLYGQ
jgi:hypothetical protein